MLYLFSISGNSTALKQKPSAETSPDTKEEKFEIVCEDPRLRIIRQDIFDLGVYKFTFYTEVAGQYFVKVFLKVGEKRETISDGRPLKLTVLPGIYDA